MDGVWNYFSSSEWISLPFASCLTTSETVLALVEGGQVALRGFLDVSD